MREIKFRAKLEGSKEWIYGTYYKLEITHRIVDELTIATYDIDENTLGQYIGLKDRKGKEVYEGDIVGFYPYELSKQRHKRGLLIRGKIVFNNNSQFCIRYVDMFEPEGETDYLFSKECEVIGNIYENSDLLTSGKQKETNSS